MDRQTAIRKVLRCLRMASSSNPNEAAAALRQARALMSEHGLTEADAYASEIHQAEAPTRCRGAMLTQSLSFLANTVAEGFRCDIVVNRTLGYQAKTVINFYGAGSDAEIAAYAFTVLRRKLEADRAKHTARIRKRANKEARGEQFAIGWIQAVRLRFAPAELPDGRAAALENAIALKAPGTTKSDAREIGKHGKATWEDRAHGFLKGTGAHVNAGLGENKQGRLESQS